MATKIRLSRGGAKGKPFYRVVVADSRMARDGRFIERIGSFNPLLPQESLQRLVMDKEKAKSWLSKGAQPTDRVARLLAQLGLMEAPIRHNPKKALPKKKAQARQAALQATSEASQISEAV